MTLDEAKLFFSKYNGNSFFMAREEPEKYQLFRNLKISDKVLDLWFKDLLDEIATKVLNDEPQKND